MSGFLGTALSSALSFVGAQQTNAQNAQNAAAQMAYSKWSQEEAERFNQEQRGLSQDFASHEATVNRNWQAERLDNAMAFSANEADKARAWNEQQRLDVQAWEQAMSSSAYQRSVADMKAAGLNPILGVASGGASTPSASSAPSPSPTGAAGGGAQGSSPGASVGTTSGSTWTARNALGDAVNSGLAALRTFADIDSIGQQISQSRAATAKLSADADVSRATASNVQADTLNKSLQPEVIRQSLTNMGLEPDRIKALTGQLNSASVAARAAASASDASAELMGSQRQFQDWKNDFAHFTGVVPGEGTTLTGPAAVAAYHARQVGRVLGSGYSAAGPPAGSQGYSARSNANTVRLPVFDPGSLSNFIP